MPALHRSGGATCPQSEKRCPARQAKLRGYLEGPSGDIHEAGKLPPDGFQAIELHWHFHKRLPSGHAGQLNERQGQNLQLALALRIRQS